MSHVVSIKTKFRNLNAMFRAAKACGLEVRNKQTYNWYGRHVGDYKMPEGFRADQLGKCDYALGVPGNSRAYEAGIYRKSADEYGLIFDFWDNGKGLMDHLGDNEANKYTEEYNLQVAQMAAEQQGWITQRDGQTLTIYHPTGANMTVGKGGLEASGFVGSACTQPMQLIADAMGVTTETENTSEYYVEELKLDVHEE